MLWSAAQKRRFGSNSQRQRDREHGTFAQLALHADAAAVGFDQLPGNEQAQPEALAGLSEGFLAD